MSKTAKRSSRRSAGIVIAGLLLPALLCACKGVQDGPGAAGTLPAKTVRTVSDGSYAALGDSYTSSPILDGNDGNPFFPGYASHPTGCMRSDADYPVLIARALRPRSFVNVSCFGASTYEMSHAQQAGDGRANPPQFSALSPADTLVTVQAGGDDIDFSKIIETCGLLSLTDPGGAPCMDHYTAAGTDALAQAIASTAPKIVAMLSEIRKRSPHARILLIGYPDILPLTGNGCWPLTPIARGDVPYLRNIETSLNAMLAASAPKAGATYVDTYRGTIGHDVCQSPGVKWVEGLIPTSLALPMHPNASGEQAMARIILATLH